MKRAFRLTSMLWLGIVSTGCGASDRHPDDAHVGPSTVHEGQALTEVAQAIVGVAVPLYGFGDPGSVSINPRLKFDDSRMRALFPAFDGLERPFADVAGSGRLWLRHMTNRDGIDLYETSIIYVFSAPEVSQAQRAPVTFGLATNVGEFHPVAQAWARF